MLLADESAQKFSPVKIQYYFTKNTLNARKNFTRSMAQKLSYWRALCPLSEPSRRFWRVLAKCAIARLSPIMSWAALYGRRECPCSATRSAKQSPALTDILFQLSWL